MRGRSVQSARPAWEARAVVVLTPRAMPSLCGLPHQMPATSLEQLAVRWMGDGLGHHSRVDDDPLHAADLHDAAAPCSLDGGH